MLNFEDLTKEELNFISNGCGAKRWKFNLPTWLQLPPCKKHDFKYWQGCTHEDRQIADDELYVDSKAYAKSKKQFYKRIFYRFIAYSFYKLVVINGKKAFYYAHEKKTQARLKAEMMLEKIKRM